MKKQPHLFIYQHLLECATAEWMISYSLSSCWCLIPSVYCNWCVPLTFKSLLSFLKYEDELLRPQTELILREVMNSVLVCMWDCKRTSGGNERERRAKEVWAVIWNVTDSMTDVISFFPAKLVVLFHKLHPSHRFFFSSSMTPDLSMAG